MANPSNLAAALQYKQRQDQLARADQQLEGLFNRAPATEPQLSTRESLENLSMGLGSGFQSQLEGGYQLATKPIQSAKAMYQGAKEAFKNPSMIADALKYVGKQAASGPLGFGEVAGGFISPRSLMPKPMKKGIFVGKKSTTWDPVSASKAVEMEAKGIAPEQIWKETGTWRAPDNQLRQEISDAGMEIKEPAYKKFKKFKQDDDKSMDLPDLVEHKQLYAAYPESRKTLMMAGNPEGGGSASPLEWNYIRLGNPKFYIPEVRNEINKKTLTHELQHLVQADEGFAIGGDLYGPSNGARFEDLMPPDVVKKMEQLSARIKAAPNGSIEKNKAIYESLRMQNDFDKFTKSGQYLRLAGEAEARAAERRMNMTPEQRRSAFPPASYDVPIDELSVHHYKTRNGQKADPQEIAKALQLANKKEVQVDIRPVSNRKDTLNLSKIVVDQSKRKQGLGSKAMQQVIDSADADGKTITLSPSTDYGATSVNRLKDFYKKFGFVENKGKNKDFTISESMYRLPQSAERN